MNHSIPIHLDLPVHVMDYVKKNHVKTSIKFMGMIFIYLITVKHINVANYPHGF